MQNEICHFLTPLQKKKKEHFFFCGTRIRNLEENCFCPYNDAIYPIDFDFYVQKNKYHKGELMLTYFSF